MVEVNTEILWSFMSFTWVSSSVGQLSDTDPDQVIKVAQKKRNNCQEEKL
jgi:hypothetical protein